MTVQPSPGQPSPGQPPAGQPPANTASPCPSCGAPVYPGDNFCEACRAALTPGPGNVSPAAAQPSAAPACPGCGGTAFTPDGYCEACGRKKPSGRDHIETDLHRLAGVTDRGLRHYRNEDAMALAAIDAASGPVLVAVVCDGVSGSERGDEASQAGAEAALAVLAAAAEAGEEPEPASLRAVAAAQDAVAGLARRGESTAPQETVPGDAPSSTYVSAVLSGETVTVCWLGDSRAYWFDARDASAARQLTTDDSLAEALVARGALSADEAMASPQAHVVTGWLGADASDTEPHVTSLVPTGPGAVLVCSDGLWNYLPDASELAAKAMPGASTDPLGTARSLVDFALAAGGHDNVTVVIAPFPPTFPSNEPAKEKDQ